MPKSNFDRYLDDLIAQNFQTAIYSTPPTERASRRASHAGVDSFIMSRAIPALSDEDVHRLEVLLTNNPSAAIARDFVATHIANFPDFLTATFDEFSRAYLGT